MPYIRRTLGDGKQNITHLSAYLCVYMRIFGVDITELFAKRPANFTLHMRLNFIYSSSLEVPH